MHYIGLMWTRLLVDHRAFNARLVGIIGPMWTPSTTGRSLPTRMHYRTDVNVVDHRAFTARLVCIIGPMWTLSTTGRSLPDSYALSDRCERCRPQGVHCPTRMHYRIDVNAVDYMSTTGRSLPDLTLIMKPMTHSSAVHFPIGLLTVLWHRCG